MNHNAKQLLASFDSNLRRLEDARQEYWELVWVGPQGLSNHNWIQKKWGGLIRYDKKERATLYNMRRALAYLELLFSKGKNRQRFLAEYEKRLQVLKTLQSS